MNRPNILYIGPISAVGGISIHIKRLSGLMAHAYNVSFIDESPVNSYKKNIYNIRSKNIIGYLRLMLKAQIVHIHSTIWWLRLFHVIFARLFLKKTILTVHSLSTVNSKLSLYVLRGTIYLSSKVILVSEEIRDKVNIEKAVVRHAFIPPNKNEIRLPSALSKMIETLSQKNKLVVGNAYKLNLYQDQDLYGLDLLIDVAEYIKRDSKNIVIVFVITTLSENKNLFDLYIKRIRKKKLNEIIRIVSYPLSFVGLVSRCDIVVRPTNTDGDALTVREGLYLNKTVIASDVVKRPFGTILFKSRDSMDLYAKILQHIDQERGTLKKRGEAEYVEFYRNLYSD